MNHLQLVDALQSVELRASDNGRLGSGEPFDLPLKLGRARSPLHVPLWVWVCFFNIPAVSGEINMRWREMMMMLMLMMMMIWMMMMMGLWVVCVCFFCGP
ncbi:hypothetical protein Hanom_Chr07g00641301 [Helianthus anomalus]